MSVSDIARLPPFLLMAGADDEAFVRPRLSEPLISAVSANGQSQLIKGQSHFGVMRSEPATTAIHTFLERTPR